MAYEVYFPLGVPGYAFGHGDWTYEKGATVLPMVHRDWDLFHVAEGKIIWIFKDGKMMTARKGEFILLPPYVPVQRPSPKTRLIYRFCHFNFRVHPDMFSAPKTNHPFEPIIQKDSIGPGNATPIPLLFHESEAPKVLAAYEKLFSIKVEPKENPWRFEQAILEIVSQLVAFAELCQRKSRKNQNFSQPFSYQDARVFSICKRINENPELPWRVTELAKSAGISAGHLHLLCKKTFGKSLKEYIMESRLKKALGLLKEEQPAGKYLSVKEISSRCGFASQHFFARQFKKTFHMTAVEYRNSGMLI